MSGWRLSLGRLRSPDAQPDTPPVMQPRTPWRRAPLGRRHLMALVAAVPVLLITLGFTRALSDGSAVNERAAIVRAENARLQERLDAGRREATLVRGEPFLRSEARAYGFGEPGERAFALASGAPPAPPIALLGSTDERAAPSPLDDWLELLFGG